MRFLFLSLLPVPLIAAPAGTINTLTPSAASNLVRRVIQPDGTTITATTNSLGIVFLTSLGGGGGGGGGAVSGGTNILVLGGTNINLVGPISHDYVPSIAITSNALQPQITVLSNGWIAGSNLFISGSGSAGQIAVFTGTKIIAGSNTIGGITLQLSGISSNQIIGTGQDLSFTNINLSDQFTVSPATSSQGPGLAVRDGARFTNIHIFGGLITNSVIVTNNSAIRFTNLSILDVSFASLMVPTGITFSNTTTTISRRNTGAIGVAPSGIDRIAIGTSSSTVNFSQADYAGLYWGITGISDNTTTIGGSSANNALRLVSWQTNGHRALLIESTNTATQGGTNWVLFTTQITNAPAGPNTTNLVIYYRDSSGVARRGTISVSIE